MNENRKKTSLTREKDPISRDENAYKSRSNSLIEKLEKEVQLKIAYKVNSSKFISSR